MTYHPEHDTTADRLDTIPVLLMLAHALDRDDSPTEPDETPRRLHGRRSDR